MLSFAEPALKWTRQKKCIGDTCASKGTGEIMGTASAGVKSVSRVGTDR